MIRLSDKEILQSNIFNACALIVNLFAVYIIALFSYEPINELYKTSIVTAICISISLFSIAFPNRTFALECALRISVIGLSMATLIKLTSMF